MKHKSTSKATTERRFGRAVIFHRSSVCTKGVHSILCMLIPPLQSPSPFMWVDFRYQLTWKITGKKHFLSIHHLDYALPTSMHSGLPAQQPPPLLLFCTLFAACSLKTYMFMSLLCIFPKHKHLTLFVIQHSWTRCQLQDNIFWKAINTALNLQDLCQIL